MNVRYIIDLGYYECSIKHIDRTGNLRLPGSFVSHVYSSREHTPLSISASVNSAVILVGVREDICHLLMAFQTMFEIAIPRAITPGLRFIYPSNAPGRDWQFLAPGLPSPGDVANLTSGKVMQHNLDIP